MILNIKPVIYFLLFVSTFAVNGQIFDRGSSNTTHKTVAFHMGVSAINAVGNSYIAENSRQNIGFDVRAKLHLIDNLTLGIGASVFTLETIGTNPLYDSSTVASIGFDVGYQILQIEKFDFTVSAGLYTVSYSNTINFEQFRDTGTSYPLTFEAAYNYNRYLQLYAGPQLRFDRLNIDAAAEIDSQFNKVDYLNFNFGVRIILWNDEENDE